MKPNMVKRRRPLVVTIEGKIARVQIAGRIVVMDVEDLHLLDGWTLSCTTAGYVLLSGSTVCKPMTKKYLHRAIVNAPNGMTVDHISGDTQDNRKINLRICTQAENCRNNKGKRTRKSVYKGVSFCPWAWGSKKWRAQLSFNKKRVPIGLFETEELAARAYNAKAAEVFGEFAKVNTLVKGAP